jgi:repressor LexA
MLTKKQKETLDFINCQVESNGYSPSLDEIRKHFKLASISTAQYYVKKLEKEGYLKKEFNQPRSIRINSDQIINNIPKITESFSIPIMGSANAGRATIFAEKNIEGYLKVPNNLISKKNSIFALRVEGDSMNKARIDGKYISNGNFVLIDSDYKTPKNDDYVLSIIDGCANIKKFEKNHNNEIRLISESTNLTHKPIYISSEDDFMINGKIIAVIKK